MWESWSAFFAMDGYAFYVWGSYGVTAVFILIEVILLVRQKRSLVQRLSRIARMNRE